MSDDDVDGMLHTYDVTPVVGLAWQVPQSKLFFRSHFSFG